MDNAELIHYGVKGMKWGVRRTPAQLGHQGKPKKVPKRARESPKNKKSQNKPKKKVQELSNDELREAINRLDMEKRYKELERNAKSQPIDEGKKFVKNVLKKSGENVATQFAVFALATMINKAVGASIINPKKG